eukprot:CAMPEP_0195036254 /NCGR_PEP_ID=MMETSP0326_2-20130528/72060_1 /TAXON_ID=2866 ORGANISM="Crypthecodinium cohnii, Strain Seligo" /NCGR_SAMPLE_ID=MMETSP0326_2 /ASSEMBLY_ACC=CAM_ASM_000348 /LENGTH=177 /DNA_ID=CAMNT_0040061787 /DNA_START=326 /DNA_END=856 /DNA_ORIENTATION=-
MNTGPACMTPNLRENMKKTLKGDRPIRLHDIDEMVLEAGRGFDGCSVGRMAWLTCEATASVVAVGPDRSDAGESALFGQFAGVGSRPQEHASTRSSRVAGRFRGGVRDPANKVSHVQLDFVAHPRDHSPHDIFVDFFEAPSALQDLRFHELLVLGEECFGIFRAYLGEGVLHPENSV